MQVDARKLLLPALLLVVAVFTASLSITASAQAIDVWVVNSLDRPVSVIVNDEIVVVKPRSTITVDPGSTVCTANETIALGEAVRLRFNGWLVDSVLVKRPCIIAEQGSVLEPFYEVEYLVTVNSVPDGLFSLQSWYMSGIIDITVPRTLELEGAKYTLRSASIGLLQPDPVNRNLSILELAVYSPMTVTLYYDAVYRVNIILGTYGIDDKALWIKAGSSTVTSIPPEIMLSDKVKLVLSRITASGAEVRLLTPLGTVEIKALKPGAEVFPIYTKYYMVKYETAAGVVERWVPEGGQLNIDAMGQRQQEAGDYRLVFKQWDGDIISMSPVLTIVVDRPLELKAVYQIEWRVTVDSLVGTREYWVPDGGTQVIFVPPELPGVLIGRQLDFYLVNGQKVEPGPGGFLKVGPIKEPVQVVAVYKSIILWNNIAVLASLLIGVVLIYIAYDLFASGWDRGEEEKEQEEEDTEEREKEEKEPSGPSVGPWAS